MIARDLRPPSIDRPHYSKSRRTSNAPAAARSTTFIGVVAVLGPNLALENFVEPKVMGKTLDIHPLVVLIVTALGGLLEGIVGLMLAVPAWVIASDAISRARSRGVFEQVAAGAQPTVQHLIDD